MFIPRELDRLVYWIKEREAIRKKKEAGKPKPWTKDPIFRDWRFCNVCRKDDRVSQWILHNWYEKYESVPPRTMVLAAALARNINWPTSLEVIGFPLKWNPTKVLSELMNIEGKVFTGAYIINGARGGDKRGQVVANMDTIYRSMDESGFPLLSRNSITATWKNLSLMPGQGSFMAGQIAADLCWTPVVHALDMMEWAPLGPGSQRGMRRLLGTNDRFTQREFDGFMETLCSTLHKRVPSIWRDRNLVAMDIQNCLCEFDKYRRTENSEGTPRSRYPGKA